MACTHYDLSAPLEAPVSASAVAERGGASIHFSEGTGATAYTVYAARIPGVTPENAASISGLVRVDAERSPVRLELTVDAQPWYVIVSSRRGKKESGATPPLAVQPLAADAPYFDATVAWTETASDAGDHFGAVLARGDFNGDGIDDLVDGAPDDDQPGAVDGGEFEVFLGRLIGVPQTSDIVVSQTAANGRYAAALAVGDFDCDGLDDLAVGHPGGDVPSARGLVDFFHGGPSLEYFDDIFPPVSVSGTNLGFGNALAAGDTNGDGCDDLLVAERGRVGHVPSVHLFLGGPWGALGEPAISRIAPANAELGGWGAALAIADVNGDGLGDVVVGEASSGQNEAGRVALFLGPDGLAPANEPEAVLSGDDPLQHFGTSVTAADMDGDGFAEVLVSTFPVSEPPELFVFAGRQYPASGLSLMSAFDGTSVDPQAPLTAHASDVDGDGFSDLLLGDPQQPSATTDSAGGVALYLGGPAGLSSAAVFTLTPPAGAIYYGGAITAGDFDGDGLLDIVVGAPQSDNERGAAYHHPGSATRGPRADAGFPQGIVGDYPVYPAGSWFEDADAGNHVCEWMFGLEDDFTIDPCTQENVGDINPYWNRGAGRFTIRLRVTAADERFGEAFTTLTVVPR